MQRQLSFADIAIEENRKPSRILKKLERINELVDWNKILKGFELARLDIHNAKPHNVKNINPIFIKGEPNWGKAFYVPSISKWDKWLVINKNIEDELKKAISIYVVLDIHGRAFDVIEWYNNNNNFNSLESLKEDIKDVYRYSNIDRFIFHLIMPLKLLVKKFIKNFSKK